MIKFPISGDDVRYEPQKVEKSIQKLIKDTRGPHFSAMPANAASDYFTGKQIFPSGFAEQHIGLLSLIKSIRRG